MEAHNVEISTRLTPEMKNQGTIELLYKALQQGDTSTVTKVVASDVEWWFHGPHHCQHMMRLLTGEPPRQVSFRLSQAGSRVYWVHVWKLKDGVVTELREYFNTWLTVTDYSLGAVGWDMGRCTVWESVPRDLARGSLPSLLLAI
ncbi:putative wound-induced protein Wun1 [Arabidopsis thaliana]